MASTKHKWTSEQSYHLLQAMRGYKPFGIEKHFQMMFILEKFRSRSNIDVSADTLWDHIEEYYDINQLTKKEIEKLKIKTIDFSL